MEVDAPESEGQFEGGMDAMHGEDGSARGSLTVFPLTRVKRIMKSDKDVGLCSHESVLLAARATVCSKPLY